MPLRTSSNIPSCNVLTRFATLLAMNLFQGESAPPIGNLNRRKFLKSTSSAAGIFGASALVLTTPRSLQAYPSTMNSGVVGKTISAAEAVYQSGWSDPSAFSSFASQISTFANYCGSVGFDQQLALCLPYSVNGGVTPFDSSFQSYLHQTIKNGTGYDLGLDYFLQTSATQPTPAQVQAVNTAALFQQIHYNGMSWNKLASQIVEAATPKRVTEGQAVVASAAGGVLVGGGAGLMAGSGTTLATLAGASISSAVLFTGGAVLVVVGVAIAAYYGWQFIQAQAIAGVPDVDTTSVDSSITYWPA